MNTASRPTRLVTAILAGLVLALPSPAAAQKVFLNPSNQTGNPVSGGGNEAEYAMANALVAADILAQAGFQVVVDADFTNAPANANSWGADIFVSIHSNAGGGHGTETLYKTTNGQALATRIQAGMLSRLPYGDRGLVQRDNLWVLNQTAMVAALAEAVFHDCVIESGLQGHPPSESMFLRSAEGQAAIGAGIAAGVCAWFGSDCAPVAPLKGILKGVVYRAPDLADRIAGATVLLDDGNSTVASATGYWEFELDPGTYTATARAEGYEPASTTRTVGAGDEVWGSIGLVPATAMSDPDTDIAEEAAPNDLGNLFPDLVPDVAEDIAVTDAVTTADVLHDPGDPGLEGTDTAGDEDHAIARDTTVHPDPVAPTQDGIDSETDLAGGEDAPGERTEDTLPGPPVLVLDAAGEPDATAGSGGCLLSTRPDSGAPVLLAILLLTAFGLRRRNEPHRP